MPLMTSGYQHFSLHCVRGFRGNPYTLEHSTTLHNRETKQVEMVRARGIQSSAIYVYHGGKSDPNEQNWPLETIWQQERYGTLSNPKVWVMQECKNSVDNHLGMPLP